MNNKNHLQDRGTKKWTTMMLPEHKEQLQEMWKHTQSEKRPEFDEQQLEVFSHTVVSAYHKKLPVCVTYCDASMYHKQNIRELTGVITEVNSLIQAITLESTRIFIKDFLDIQIADVSL